jgi:Derlin-2/3
MDQFWSAPPVTRTITALTFVQSLLVYGGLHNSYYVPYLTGLVFKFPPEIWRLGSSFLLTGPKLDFIFDLYFMFTYGSALETTSPWLNGPGDFITYLFFVATVILVSHRAHQIQMRNRIGSGQYFFCTSDEIVSFSNFSNLGLSARPAEN